MTTKFPPSMIGNGTPNTILGTSNTNAVVEYPLDYLKDLEGCELVWLNTNNITINPGVRPDPVNGNTIIINTALTKNLNAAWAQGNNSGGLVTGVKAPNTSYHMYLIKRITTGAGDAIFSSTINPTPPAGWTLGPRLGTVYTNASSDLKTFRQTGKTFMFTSFSSGNGPEGVGIAVGPSFVGEINIAFKWVPIGFPATVYFMAYSGYGNGGLRITYIKKSGGTNPELAPVGLFDMYQTVGDMNSQLGFGGEFFLPVNGIMTMGLSTVFVGPDGGNSGHNLYTLGYVDHSL